MDPESTNLRDMDDLILRALSGEASAAERERLANWRAESPENDLEFERWRKLWELSGRGAPAVTGESPPAEELIRRGEALRASPMWTTDAPDTSRPAADVFAVGGGVKEPRAGPAGRRPQGTNWMRWAAILAALLIPAALAVGLARGGSDGPWAGDGPATADTSAPVMQVATASNEVTTINLSDGSGIRVGPGSRIEITEDPDRITVHLEGRAFFGVPPDGSRRFVVTTPLGEAAVLGTRFEVRSEDEEFRVLVVEGAVQVSAGESETQLQAGEMGRSIQGSAPTTSAVDDVAAQLDWLGNAFFFQATPLPTALREVEERFDVTIRLAAPALADQTVTASFVDQDAKEILAVLCAIVGAHCLWEGADTPSPTIQIDLPAGTAGEPEAGGST